MGKVMIEDYVRLAKVNSTSVKEFELFKKKSLTRP
jgi:hypothetical protein